MTIAIVGGSPAFERWLKNLTVNVKFITLMPKTEEEVKEGDKFNKLGIPYDEDIDLVVFTGGADVSPRLYNEQKGKYTNINEKRDKIEKDYFNAFKYIPKLGICRGSQFLTVMNGGKLIQHVSGHTQSHSMEMKDSPFSITQTFEITSTHHQMLFPFNLKNYELIAWAKTFRSDTYLDGKDKEINLPKQFLEPEIVYYPNTNSLAIQGHPEFESCPKSTSNMCKNLIHKFLLK